jgi:hypothetical protein
VVSFTLYPQGKSLWYPLDRRLSGPQSRTGRGGEEKNFQTPPGIVPYNPDRPLILKKRRERSTGSKWLRIGSGGGLL